MAGDSEQGSDDSSFRNAELDRVLEDFARRRAAGERIDEREITETYPELMPELEERLRALREPSQAGDVTQTATQVPDATPRRPGDDTLTATGTPPAQRMKGDIPQRIGRYSITRVIGSGGMGAVYEAVQEQPRRSVAVKVLKQGIASRTALRRFEYEAQLLGRLRHPNVAQIFEAGTHDDPAAPGGPVAYFAMEYIPGARLLTEYARENKLGTRQRLKLFAQICDGVHHGHQKGVIHRDLKPGNILVDADGLPKIIDFGVARSTDSDVAATTMQTDVGQLIGTLQYMSPEQCAGDPHDIDIRSDVYALGVVMYELLCDARPYDVGHVSLYDAVRVIREQVPTKLSTVNRTLRGDIETICQKAIEKNREQRYASAGDLAEDIRRYLAGEAIIARPPSVAYQLRVFARRNKVVVGAVAAVLLVLIGATIVSTSMYFRAEAARRVAVEQRKVAESQLVRAEQVTGVMEEMFAGVRPAVALGRDTTMLREMMDATAERVGTDLKDQPEVEAEIRHTIGSVYYDLGAYEPGKEMLTRALELRRATLGEEHADVADTMDRLATLQRDLDNLDEAVRLYREALDIRRKVRGESDPDVATSAINLAYLLQTTGDYDGAEALYREGIGIRQKLVRDGRTEVSAADVALDQHFFATLLHDKGDYEEAERVYREALATDREVLPENHPNLADLLNSFAALLQDMKKLDEAERHAREALAIHRKVYGEEHNRVAGDLNMVASLLRDKGDYAQAEEMHRQALAIRRELFGDDHTRVGITLSSLGLTLTKMEKYPDAESVLLEAHGILKQNLGDHHPRTLDTVERLAELYEAWGRPDAAAPYRQIIQTAESESERE